ncbi:MAG TPA: cob(I)yrinic acid a,c-diamide adenosyltransferase [Actinomycetes bacterium]|nr:cob(I)yrinic acid a,c-diamide adenosyltransferase [Actinomycetes bacterium]
MRIYTRRGDDGTTGLLYGGRVPKSDPRTEAYGTTDEAVAALGVARAFLPPGPLADLVLRLQRELFVAGAELATQPRNAHKLVPGATRVTAGMVADLERLIDEHAERVAMPAEFVVPGESRGSALLDQARSVVRRAERRAVELAASQEVGGDLLRYLNRLSDLLFVLARFEEGGFRALHEEDGGAPDR